MTLYGRSVLNFKFSILTSWKSMSIYVLCDKKQYEIMS